MTKLTLLIGALALVVGKACAQHCAYDGVKIMVLAATSPESKGTIPGLRITVLDSAGIPVMSNAWSDNRLVRDTLRFWQNPANDRGKPAKHYTIPGSTRRFWFAKDHYVLVVGYVPSGAKIRVEDPDGASNGGPYQTQILELNQGYLFPLCTGQSHWTRPDNPSFVTNYRPVRIRLRALQ